MDPSPNDFRVRRVANGFIVEPPSRGDYPLTGGIYVFNEPGDLARWFEAWARGGPLGCGSAVPPLDGRHSTPARFYPVGGPD